MYLPQLGCPKKYSMSIVISCESWLLGSLGMHGLPALIFPLTHETVEQQHTKGCLSCLGAVKMVNRCLKTAKVSAVASLAWVSKAGVKPSLGAPRHAQGAAFLVHAGRGRSFQILPG